MSKYKQTIIDGKIVYANWFLRQGEAIWDFVYGHVLPMRTWYKLIDWKDRFKYAMERAFIGFDRRISWGYESTIAFYKRLLSDLYKHTHGHPTNLWEICPKEWDAVEKKWKEFLGQDKDITKLTFSDEFFMDSSQRELFFDDCFDAWKKYIKRVLHYFEEADPDTCSKKELEKKLYSQMKNPLNEKNRTVVEHNGEYFYQYPSLGDSKEDNEQRKILEELNEIDEYQLEQLKLGMAEVAKNIVYLND